MFYIIIIDKFNKRKSSIQYYNKIHKKERTDPKINTAA